MPGPQKPKLAKHSQALFSGGQQDGHSAPGLYSGFVPALQKDSLAKQPQVWSGVLSTPLPGQQAWAGHSQPSVVQPGQSVSQRLELGRWPGALGGAGLGAGLSVPPPPPNASTAITTTTTAADTAPAASFFCWALQRLAAATGCAPSPDAAAQSGAASSSSSPAFGIAWQQRWC